MEKERTPNDIILEGVSSGKITKEDATILLDAIYSPFGNISWNRHYPHPYWEYKSDEQPSWTITSSTDEQKKANK